PRSKAKAEVGDRGLTKILHAETIFSHELTSDDTIGFNIIDRNHGESCSSSAIPVITDGCFVAAHFSTDPAQFQCRINLPLVMDSVGITASTAGNQTTITTLDTGMLNGINPAASWTDLPVLQVPVLWAEVDSIDVDFHLIGIERGT